MTTWTNDKARSCNAGEGGSLYPTFKPFTVDEIQQHIGIYFLDGMNPSPNIEFKFHSTKEEKYDLRGNYF